MEGGGGSDNKEEVNCCFTSTALRDGGDPSFCENDADDDGAVVDDDGEQRSRVRSLEVEEVSCSCGLVVTKEVVGCNCHCN